MDIKLKVLQNNTYGVDIRYTVILLGNYISATLLFFLPFSGTLSVVCNIEKKNEQKKEMTRTQKS